MHERFCGDCAAAPAGHAASAATTSPQAAFSAPKIRVAPEQPDASTAADGERKTVTALFADIKGSMELTRPPNSIRVYEVLWVKIATINPALIKDKFWTRE
jgi:hypothetical protein